MCCIVTPVQLCLMTFYWLVNFYDSDRIICLFYARLQKHASKISKGTATLNKNIWSVFQGIGYLGNGNIMCGSRDLRSRERMCAVLTCGRYGWEEKVGSGFIVFDSEEKEKRKWRMQERYTGRFVRADETLGSPEGCVKHEIRPYSSRRPAWVDT